MNKNTLLILIIGILALGAGIAFYYYPTNTPDTVPLTSSKDATFMIDGKLVTLSDGSTKYFGNEINPDLNGDGRADSVFILTQSPGGSGTFYYVVAALNTPSGYIGSDAILLGDRIAPQTIEMSQSAKTPHVIVVNYADRRPSESFAVAPSVGKSLWLLLDTKTMQFGEVAQNFEGEANPSMMKLDMKTWNWVDTIYSNGSTTAPKSPGKFTLTFKQPNIFSATTDCNGVGGEYVVNGSAILFTKMMSTLMYCEGSQEGDFSKALGEVQSYHFTSKGELVFDLKFDSGSILLQ